MTSYYLNHYSSVQTCQHLPELLQPCSWSSCFRLVPSTQQSYWGFKIKSNCVLPPLKTLFWLSLVPERPQIPTTAATFSLMPHFPPSLLWAPATWDLWLRLEPIILLPASPPPWWSPELLHTALPHVTLASTQMSPSNEHLSYLGITHPCHFFLPFCCVGLHLTTCNSMCILLLVSL